MLVSYRQDTMLFITTKRAHASSTHEISPPIRVPLTISNNSPQRKYRRPSLPPEFLPPNYPVLLTPVGIVDPMFIKIRPSLYIREFCNFQPQLLSTSTLAIRDQHVSFLPVTPTLIKIMTHLLRPFIQSPINLKIDLPTPTRSLCQSKPYRPII